METNIIVHLRYCSYDETALIGKNNKGKIIAEFKEKLNLNNEDVDNLYNQCSEIIVK